MYLRNRQLQREQLRQVSRRSVLGGAAALAATQTLSAFDEREDDNQPSFAYVGAYTPNSAGFYLFQLALQTESSRN